MHMLFRKDVYKYIILSITDFFLTPQVMMKSFWHKINYRHLEIKKKNTVPLTASASVK